MRSLLPRLRQPSRYTGIEQGAVHKDPSAVTVRAALCFPDLYEVGMSHLGQKIIYGIINRHPSWWAERCYEPDREDCAILRETGTRLATLASAYGTTADNMLTQYEESSLRKTLLWESLMAKVAEMSEISETTTEAAVS